ncbi:HNH endonuclease [Paracoccus sp. S1E-3]|uniref:HNH endonuclease n=1 Tax=Paracoccus sp. S1E-3 TaxID=2756130 RepID=UPI0015EF630D|nr:HNH endonuclease [Paracoccus sp. S1E-3]MBA4492666.1 HNH endonuclease [Paracoccus sp. S1E-3]
MTKAVFIESSHSTYADKPGELYHFPNSYLSRVEKTLGDWVIFYEGRRGDAKGYHRVQRVSSIAPDPTDPTHSFAIMDRASEIDFETRLSRQKPDGTLWESKLAFMGGNNTSSVRPLSDQDFDAMLRAAFTTTVTPDTLPRQPDGFSEAAPAFDFQQRPKILTTRALRDASFARNVRRAYSGRCAISGLELRNGGGRAEVEAAHIRPITADGPDTIRNGLALSGTIHWMFDRGLIAVDDDMSLLTARDSIADEVSGRLFNPAGRLILPQDPALKPHPDYLRWHREHCFKG